MRNMLEDGHSPCSLKAPVVDFEKVGIFHALPVLLILPVPSQESERSCICVLGLLILLPVSSQESERSCICARVIDFACTKSGE